MNRLALFILTALVSCSHGHSTKDTHQTTRLFQEWATHHNKTYSHKEEFVLRFKTFVKNVQLIDRLNKRPVKSVDPPRFGLNQFADLSPEEFKSKILLPPRKVKQHKHAAVVNVTSTAPETFDWTIQDGVVTPVKDQGQDGTCWAFAGVANLEGLFTIKSGTPSPSLSTESLNDCDGLSDTRTGAIACGPLGGLMEAVYQFVKNEGGIMTEDDYPYCVGSGDCAPCQPPDYNERVCGGAWPVKSCKESDSCSAKYDPSKFVPGLKVKDYIRITNEDILEEKLTEIGPLAAGIDAADMQFYEGGILTPMLCDPNQLNHAVVLVGYDSASAEPHWRAKNSWGSRWGEKGFLRIKKGINACGIGSDVSSAVLE